MQRHDDHAPERDRIEIVAIPNYECGFEVNYTFRTGELDSVESRD